MVVGSEESFPQKFYETLKRKRLKKMVRKPVSATILIWFVVPVLEELLLLGSHLV